MRALRPMGVRDDPFLNRPVKASASFRVRWRGGLRVGVGGGAAVGPLVSLVEWLLARKRSGLPTYSYVAVDSDKLYVAELRYGPTISVRRIIGTWDLSKVDPEPLEDPWAVRLKLGARVVELEASDPNPGAREVVRLILASR